MTSDSSVRLIDCPVCGTGIDTAPWACPRCETPHHEDCAQYFGGCAIYGCRDGHLPAPLEVRTWPRAVSILQTVRRVRQIQAGFLIMALVSVPVAVFAVLLQLPLFFALCFPVFLGSSTLYMLTDIPARWIQAGLDREVRRADAAGREVSPSRLEQVVPRITQGQQAYKGLRITGQALLAFSPLFFLVMGSSALPTVAVVAFSGLMLIEGGRQLGRHLQEIEVARNRFEATYAPRLPDKTIP